MTVCGLRAGRTKKEIMSYGNINKSTVYDVERKFGHFHNTYENVMWKDALRYPEIAITSSRTTPLPKTARRCRTGSRRTLYRGVGGVGWPPSSADCNPFDYFVWGVSELRVNAKSHNKFKDLIQKMKEVMGPLGRDTPAKASTSFRSTVGSRLSSLLSPDGSFIDKLILNMYLCTFFYFNKN
jgi:hypothetical protein